MVLLPADRELSVDILSHSRGGLVARALAEPRRPLSLRVRKVLMVAAPNRGTALAEPKAVLTSIDLLSNLCARLPPNVAGIAVSALVEAARVFSHDFVDQPGLKAMRESTRKTEDNAFPATDPAYFVLAADWEPPKDDPLL